jgi:hypothetical protein
MTYLKFAAPDSGKSCEGNQNMVACSQIVSKDDGKITQRWAKFNLPAFLKRVGLVLSPSFLRESGPSFTSQFSSRELSMQVLFAAMDQPLRRWVLVAAALAYLYGDHNSMWERWIANTIAL